MTSSVLIVEDEAIIAEDLRQTLEWLGYTIFDVVRSGEAALEAVNGRTPDLVLMDVRLRGPMDGIDAARELQARASVPIIYLTSHSDEATLNRAKVTAPHGYLLKPFSDRDLRTAIEVALAKHGVERTLAERERWFATTLRSIGDAVMTTDLDGRITFMNDAAERLTGTLATELVGQPIEVSAVMRLPEGQSECPVGRAMSTRAVVDVRWEGVVAGTGAPILFEGTVAPLLDRARELLGVVLVFRDAAAQRGVYAHRGPPASGEAGPTSSVNERASVGQLLTSDSVNDAEQNVAQALSALRMLAAMPEGTCSQQALAMATDHLLDAATAIRALSPKAKAKVAETDEKEQNGSDPPSEVSSSGRR
jgi:PAS domain S-box-containing protein